VIAREMDTKEKALVAYLVGSNVSVAGIKAYLLEYLPAYMVPSYFVVLAQLPLNTNGKVDKKALPVPEYLPENGAGEYISPRNDREQKLAGLWHEILGRDKVSVRDDFFELGGHSLKATRLMAMVNKTFNVQYSIGTFFRSPTIEKMADEIERIYWAAQSETGDNDQTNLENFTL